MLPFWHCAIAIYVAYPVKTSFLLVHILTKNSQKQIREKYARNWKLTSKKNCSENFFQSTLWVNEVSFDFQWEFSDPKTKSLILKYFCLIWLLGIKEGLESNAGRVELWTPRKKLLFILFERISQFSQILWWKYLGGQSLSLWIQSLDTGLSSSLLLLYKDK